MKKSNDNMDIQNDGSKSSLSIADKITGELSRLLFKQLPYAIIAQLLVATLFIVGFKHYHPTPTIALWYGYMLIASLYWTSVASLYQLKQHILQTKTWILLYGVGTFLSGVAWGYVALFLIPAETSALQIYIVAIILGMTAGANPFFNPIISVYLSFLIPSFIPLGYWFFAQGGIFFYLGLCSIVYFGVMVLCCYLANASLKESARLRFENTDLDSLNQLLEQRVADRTSDLEKSLAITKSTLESTADGILVIDDKGHVEYVNQKFMEIWRVNKDFVDEANFKLFNGLIKDTVTQANSFIEIINRINQQPYAIDNGEIIFADGRVFEWYSQPHIVREKVNGRVWSFRDMSIRKQMEHQLAYQASHDTLTDLPNRALLYDRIDKGMLYADRFSCNLIVMFLDIDNFKLINDNLGHDNGDVLLKTIAKRLQHCVRKSDTVARFGGDEFIIVFFANDTANIMKMAKHLLEEITRPIHFSDHEIVVTTSIGISIYPEDGTDSTTLLKHADMAMYAAKNKGKNNIKYFDNTIRSQAKKTLSYQMDLRHALVKNQFKLVFQPFIDLKSMHIIGCEALIRWQHPKEGLLMPAQFIRIAEESGQINDIGNWVIEEACRQNMSWQSAGLKAITMSVNVSAVQLMRDDFLSHVKNILDKLNYPPDKLELELTESTIMENKEHIAGIIMQLKELKIGLSIDDFGTGSSNLNYLKQFPVTKIKIDRSFVFDCNTDSNEGSIVKAIVAMGHSLKLPVLAEGIEDNKYFQFLKQCKCDMGQGYHLGKPMSAEAFAELLRRQGSTEIKAS